MINQLEQEILNYIRNNNTMTIATVNKKGTPEAAAVFYVNIDYCLYFLSSPNSRHADNIGAGGPGAATIQRDYSNWQEIKGLQLEGDIKPIVKNKDKALILKKYAEKFIFLNQLAVGHKILNAFAQSQLYQFSPKVIWLTDNSQSFGNRQKIILD